ncbi:MAG: hypothetical protein RL397_530 [Pseudomonadota bacterium]|jgi:uncharacterized membrane protein YgdD (TMEM256/DUF423 family)
MTRHWRRFLFISAGIFGATGVMAGAFASHGLAALVEPRLVAIFETGARYQLVHAVAILALAAIGQHPGAGRWAVWSALSFTFGILVFSGSLYLRVLADLPALGAITPVGGLGFILGWVCVMVAGWRSIDGER